MYLARISLPFRYEDVKNLLRNKHEHARIISDTQHLIRQYSFPQHYRNIRSFALLYPT